MDPVIAEYVGVAVIDAVKFRVNFLTTCLLPGVLLRDLRTLRL
ncbi:hypothetical protein RMSM_02474 [Rhodopirellula maiorica SM1]|uniref:Uncharacterized protein n=1 Tax=Rhodopirellula maiorica SM1 TaxID=1265738 RepID=M5S334_9BACT|nr:hypothetical protein RMSM_02474 [Rhodopirellula maiorica SM1]